ncbi:MBL fold metallo-hydrolase [Arthrobacter bambusae]|uniref:MBL fold metallo-hydrolase n=1 Tax=Arthrobacter bambusae TaxID=1338426 RepID=UPI00277DA2D1|nr:MBL fold metallo-hydrolase [Arthrobacter bambusae]MDQ0029052.1 glyoxylase-like metal-dependent hydrolase (beta-lactamase superfamily II) [Arthrobacter bambusae]MDQ0098546.1 glyoxylase-like metal-dependent hydrolase (beta-lactamase superfamily II) [Arthrobacter bambusae]
MRIGSLDILPIVDGTAREPIEAAVSHPDGKVWDCADHPADEHGRLQFDIGAFLIRFDQRTVLVDAGGGVFSDERATTGQLLNNLRPAGVEPGDVTDVLFTHMHWDHIGWSTTDGKATFENATVRVHQDDWDYFMTGPTAYPSFGK